VSQFAEVCERYIRNGNPLFIPEASSNPANALLAYLKYNASAIRRLGSKAVVAVAGAEPRQPAPMARRRRMHWRRLTPSWIIWRP